MTVVCAVQGFALGGWSKARQLVENLVTRLLEKDQPDNNVENFMGGVSA